MTMLVSGLVSKQTERNMKNSNNACTKALAVANSCISRGKIKIAKWRSCDAARASCGRLIDLFACGCLELRCRPSSLSTPLISPVSAAGCARTTSQRSTAPDQLFKLPVHILLPSACARALLYTTSASLRPTGLRNLLYTTCTSSQLVAPELCSTLPQPPPDWSAQLDPPSSKSVRHVCATFLTVNRD